jgi:hypothetical protein
MLIIGDTYGVLYMNTAPFLGSTGNSAGIPIKQQARRAETRRREEDAAYPARRRRCSIIRKWEEA